MSVIAAPSAATMSQSAFAVTGVFCGCSDVALNSRPFSRYRHAHVRFAHDCIDRCRHVLLSLRLGQAAAIDALIDSALVWSVVERMCADDVTPLIASRLAEPPAIGEHRDVRTRCR